MRDLYLSRNPMAAARTLGETTIVMNPADSTFFTLNPAATAIWQLADGRSTLRQIVERGLCDEFDVAPARALDDAEEFAAALARHGILRTSAAAAE